MTAIDIGIPEDSRQTVADGLSRVLADTYTLYLMTHNFHWNVTGPMFQQLHELFEEQYRELWAAMDEVAERIRALGFFAPGTGSQLGELSTIREPRGVPSAQDMLEQVLHGHETVAKTIRDVFPGAEEGHDEATLDLLTGRLRVHEKTAWMLRSMLQ